MDERMDEMMFEGLKPKRAFKETRSTSTPFKDDGTSQTDSAIHINSSGNMEYSGHKVYAGSTPHTTLFNPFPNNNNINPSDSSSINTNSNNSGQQNQPQQHRQQQLTTSSPSSSSFSEWMVPSLNSTISYLGTLNNTPSHDDENGTTSNDNGPISHHDDTNHHNNGTSIVNDNPNQLPFLNSKSRLTRNDIPKSSLLRDLQPINNNNNNTNDNQNVMDGGYGDVMDDEALWCVLDSIHPPPQPDHQPHHQQPPPNHHQLQPTHRHPGDVPIDVTAARTTRTSTSIAVHSIKPTTPTMRPPMNPQMFNHSSLQTSNNNSNTVVPSILPLLSSDIIQLQQQYQQHHEQQQRQDQQLRPQQDQRQRQQQHQQQGHEPKRDSIENLKGQSPAHVTPNTHHPSLTTSPHHPLHQQQQQQEQEQVTHQTTSPFARHTTIFESDDHDIDSNQRISVIQGEIHEEEEEGDGMMGATQDEYGGGGMKKIPGPAGKLTPLKPSANMALELKRLIRLEEGRYNPKKRGNEDRNKRRGGNNGGLEAGGLAGHQQNDNRIGNLPSSRIPPNLGANTHLSSQQQQQMVPPSQLQDRGTQVVLPSQQQQQGMVNDTSKAMEDQADFRNATWAQMLMDVNLPPFYKNDEPSPFAEHIAVQSELLSTSLLWMQKEDHYNKIPSIIVLVKTLRVIDENFRATLRDPTAEIENCTISRGVIEKHPAFLAGCVALLENVPILSPKKGSHYLIVVPRCVKYVWPKTLAMPRSELQKLSARVYDYKSIYAPNVMALISPSPSINSIILPRSLEQQQQQHGSVQGAMQPPPMQIGSSQRQSTSSPPTLPSRNPYAHLNTSQSSSQHGNQSQNAGTGVNVSTVSSPYKQPNHNTNNQIGTRTASTQSIIGS